VAKEYRSPSVISRDLIAELWSFNINKIIYYIE